MKNIEKFETLRQEVRDGKLQLFEELAKMAENENDKVIANIDNDLNIGKLTLWLKSLLRILDTIESGGRVSVSRIQSTLNYIEAVALPASPRYKEAAAELIARTFVTLWIRRIAKGAAQ